MTRFRWRLRRRPPQPGGVGSGLAIDRSAFQSDDAVSQCHRLEGGERPAWSFGERRRFGAAWHEERQLFMFDAQQGDDSWRTIHHHGVVEGLDTGLKQPPRRDSKRPRQRVRIVSSAVVATAAAATAAAVAAALAVAAAAAAAAAVAWLLGCLAAWLLGCLAAAAAAAAAAATCYLLLATC